MRSERKKDDAALFEPSCQRAPRLGREAGRILDDDSSERGQVLDAIGQERQRPHAHVELERSQGLLDGRCATGCELGARGIGDDGDRKLAGDRGNGRLVVGDDDVAAGQPRNELTDGVVEVDPDVAPERLVRKASLAHPLVGGVDFDLAVLALPGRRAGHVYDSVISLTVGPDDGAIGGLILEVGERNPERHIGAFSDRRGVGTAVGQIGEQNDPVVGLG